LGKKVTNKKIFAFVKESLESYFKLQKYAHLNLDAQRETIISSLPWTPKRLEKFKEAVENVYEFELDFSRTLGDLVDEIDEKYRKRFFEYNGTWTPRTDDYQYTGWEIVNRINSQDPKAVLDVGCGYNQFKGKINNLVGIDIYNRCADFMVDVLDFRVPDNTYDHVLVFGSINFGSYEDVAVRMKRVVELTSPGGTIYVRVNPGKNRKEGYWIDLFPWSFEYAYKMSADLGCTMTTLKKDSHDRLYFEWVKNV